MADINAYLREAINGPAPQHKVAGRDQFEISEGSDGATHTKLVDVDGNPLSTFPVEDKAVKAELAEIKRTQAEILERLDGTFDTQLTGSIVEVFFDKIVPSQQTNNLFVGERTSSGIAGMTAIDISKYRKISMYIKNNTERPFLLRRLYFGLTAYFNGDHIDNSGTNDIEIANDDYVYVTAKTGNDITDYLTVELPFVGIHLYRGTNEPMSLGSIDVKLIGIK